MKENIICVFKDDGKSLEELIMEAFEKYLKDAII